MSMDNCDTPVGSQDIMEQPISDEAAVPKTLADLAPELLTKILEFVTTGGEMKTFLGCRQVNSNWKLIMDSIIESKISSGKFGTFPNIKVEGVDAEGDLRVRCSPPRFADGRNPFPFNSFRLDGSGSAPVKNVSVREQSQLLSLPEFASRFGGNLTSFTLYKIQTKFSITTFAAVLSSMPNLKRLTVHDVLDNKLSHPFDFNARTRKLDIPTAPLLPSLTRLTVRLHIFSSMEDKTYVVLVWLIGSYAEQLVYLHLDSVHPLPPLRAGHQYKYSVSRGKTAPIVSTSETAFRKLKELVVMYPTREFLRFSETPALKDLMMVYTFVGAVPCDFNLGDVEVYIDKCSSTLESLYFNCPWDEQRNEEALNHFLGEQRVAERRTFPRVKTFNIQYPRTNLQEMVLSAFLLKFPVVKTIYFLNFRAHQFDEDVPVNQQRNVKESGNRKKQNDEEILALKTRLAPLYQRMNQNRKEAMTALSTMQALRNNPPEGEEQRQAAAAYFRALHVDSLRLDAAMKVAQNVRTEIYNQLTALGANTKEVMVQQLVERGGFWNTFSKLGTVSVSSAHDGVGDVCVVRRTADVD